MSADNLALSRGGFFCAASAGLAAGSTNTQINAASGVVAAFDGVVVTKAATAAGYAYAPVDGRGATVSHGTQPVSTSCLWGVVMNAAGTVRITKGNVVSAAALAAGSDVLQMPPVPIGHVMLGYIKVVLDASTTFTPGTTGWATSSTNIVVTFVNTLQYPINPLTS